VHNWNANNKGCVKLVASVILAMRGRPEIDGCGTWERTFRGLVAQVCKGESETKAPELKIPIKED
jgi:hypothetical protein